METDGDVFYLIQLSLIITRPWTASLSFRMAALYAAENILCGIMIISISAAQTAVRSSTAVFMNVQVGLHIQHPLTLFYRDDKTGNISNIVLDDNSCKLDINHQESDTTDDQGKYKLVHIVPSKSDIIFDKCTWCGKDFEGEIGSIVVWYVAFAWISVVQIRFHLLLSQYPKGHHHSLIFLPRPLLVPSVEPSYACFQCSYMAHQSCIVLPRVIKITRHPHRLHYIPYTGHLWVPYAGFATKRLTSSMGNIHAILRVVYMYVAHSKCATHVTVWDKKRAGMGTRRGRRYWRGYRTFQEAWWWFHKAFWSWTSSFEAQEARHRKAMWSLCMFYCLRPVLRLRGMHVSTLSTRYVLVYLKSWIMHCTTRL